MKLIRKTNAPVFIDEYGISHPDLTVTFVAINEDKLNKRLILFCQYFHTPAANKLPIAWLGSFEFRFTNDVSVAPTEDAQYGWPTYDLVKQDITINDSGEIVVSDESVYTWILNQPYVLDFEGKLFAENWVISI